MFNRMFRGKKRSSARRSNGDRSRADCRRLAIESLERRNLLAATIGTWTTATSTSPGAQIALLQSDGSVMYQVGANSSTKTWSRLAPNSSGSYSSGTTSSLASMNVGRLFFGSAVLPSDQVFAIGGEYTGNNQNTDANSAEIFNPTAGTGGAGTWTSTASFPQSQFGDDPVEVLSPTQVLTGYIVGPQTYLYNPTNNTWTQTGTKLRNDQSDEETWIKLPDGSILSYDVFASISTGVFHAQRYVPSTGTWVDASNVSSSNPPHILSSSAVGFELGPGVLLPNGKVFLEGANGYTAYYDPVANQWSAGPMLPTNGGNQLVAADASAAMMANGDVLMALSPLGNSNSGSYNFPAPTYFYEFNPNDGSYTYANLTFSSINSFEVCMLDLPNGQVLVTNESRTLEFYTPVGSPQIAWRPTVTGYANNGGGLYTLTGTQLNGISEGASYGDDNSMSSNYPIVQFKDAAGNISYGRTANWSSVGVATGSTPVTTQVTLPAGHTAITDFASLTVIANGISSPTYAIALPAISSLSTSQGRIAGGNTVTINGTNLGNVTSVSFGSAAATVVSASATQVVATSPAGSPGTVDITATSWYGTSTTVAADQFTYLPPPTVTAANINISGATGPGGIYRVGDVVTATWDNSPSGDNNANTIASVAVNFSQFGGPTAVTATDSSNIWTASYTIAAGSINATNQNVIVSATDSVGNVTTTAGNTNAAVDNVLPTVTAANINISGATGTGGAFRPGDTVTASWNNTSGGDNNAQSIASVSVDFSQFGGPTAVAADDSGDTWTASYTILSGVTPGNNRNVIVTATNAVGNTKVTADNANATVATPPNVTVNPSNSVANAGGTASFTAAAGGFPAPSVQWQMSIDGGATFNPINGATSTTYSFTAAAGQNNNQYEAIFTNAAGSATTTAATLLVDTITTQPGGQTINAGQDTSFTAASSNPGGTDTVQWKVSSGGGFTNLSNGGVYSGVTTGTLTITSATASLNTNQYEAVFTNSSGTLASNAAALTVDFEPNVTTNPTNQTVTAGNSATVTSAAGGNPAPTVQWQVSTDGGATFTPINGATSTTYSFTTDATQSGNQYEAVFTNTLGTATTTAATLTVQTVPSVTTTPTSETVTAGGAASFTVAAGGSPAPTVQWEMSINAGATFTPISGATSTTYSFTTTAGQNNNQYEAIFTNAAGSATTTAATLNVQFAPGVTTNPTNQTVIAGNTATFTAAAGGNPAPTVQWELSTDGGATFNPIGGATSTTYSFSASAGQNGNQYEAVFTNSIGNATTTAATLTVQTVPSVSTNPTNQTVTAGSTASFTAAAGGNPAPTVQWKVSTNGGETFTPIGGATSTTYSFTAGAGQNNNQYEAFFTNAAGSATTNAATLNVQFAPGVTTNPGNQTVIAGNTATFTAAAGGNPAPSVQWELSTDGGATFNPIGGATSTTYSFTASAGQNNNQYEAVFTNSIGSATTTAANLTVQTIPSVTTNPANQTVTAGNAATFTAAGSGNPAPAVQWKVSTDGGATFNPIGGATSTTYSFTASAGHNNKQYEAVFTNVVGGATTTAATLTVQTAPSVTTNPTNQSVGAGGTATFTAAAGGNPTPTVQWQVSTDGGATFNPISGATSTTYSFTASAGQSSNEYEALFTNIVGTATTTAATLVVVPTIGTWISAVDGPWNAAGNWTDAQGAGVPGFSGLVGDQATFNGAGGVNVDLGNSSPSIAALTFGPGAPNYVIQSSGSGVLQLNNGGGTATISIAAGSQTIAAPVQLTSNTTIVPAASATLTVSNSVTGNTGTSLTLGDASDTGTLVATAPATVSLTGATNVPAGTLQVDGAWTTTVLNVTAAGGALGSGGLAGSGSIIATSGGLIYNSTAASTFAGALSGSGSNARLEVDGGRLTLSGPGTTGFAGGVVIAGGKLVVDNASDLPDGASLSIGIGTSAFSAPVAAPIAIATVSAAAPAPSPPPATPQPTAPNRAASVDAALRQPVVGPTTAAVPAPRFAPAVDWLMAQPDSPWWAATSQQNNARIRAVDVVLASRTG